MIRFRGEHTGSIMMYDEPALKLLRMMGTSANPTGALMAEDVPAALARLEAALATETQQAPTETETGSDQDDKIEKEPSVTLEQRAEPLLQLLHEAVATQSYVTWGE